MADGGSTGEKEEQRREEEGKLVDDGKKGEKERDADDREQRESPGGADLGDVEEEEEDAVEEEAEQEAEEEEEEGEEGEGEEEQEPEAAPISTKSKPRRWLQSRREMKTLLKTEIIEIAGPLYPNVRASKTLLKILSL